MEQADHIPWNLLVSHLDYNFPNQGDEDEATYLIPRFQQGQGNDLNAFVQTFAKAINEQSDIERKKYAEKYDAPDSNAIILDDDLVRRISPTIHRLGFHWVDGGHSVFYSNKLCNHEKDDPRCTCPVPYEERKVSSFLRQKKVNGCCEFYEENKLGFFNMEIVKTMLVSGDMEPILRVCAHAENHLLTWQCLQTCECEDRELGWNQVYLRALEAYLCLNLLYYIPTLLGDDKTDEQDYRHTQCYQKLLRDSAISGTAAVRPLHTDFFGISDCQFSAAPRARKDGPFAHLGKSLDWMGLRDEYPYGIMPFHDFLEFENVACHIATASEVDHVSRLLGEKGLPIEIASEIMELADYEPRRRLKVPHDPFHKDNASELEKYLSRCWDVLIRCDIMCKALGDPIKWDVWVSRCIADLSSVDGTEDSVLSERIYFWNHRGLYVFW